MRATRPQPVRGWCAVVAGLLWWWCVAPDRAAALSIGGRRPPAPPPRDDVAAPEAPDTSRGEVVATTPRSNHPHTKPTSRRGVARRDGIAAAVAVALVQSSRGAPATAAEDTDTALPVDAAELQTFDDAQFSLTYPKDFFAIRRTISGDSVRKSNVIFTAGRLNAAEIVTVERWPARQIIAQASALDFFPDAALRSWTDLGTPDALGEYLCERRDNEAQLAAKGKEARVRTSTVVPGSLRVDGSTLQADILTALGPIEMRVGDAGAKAQTPGIKRVQRARLVLLPGGKEVMAVWGSCLADYWDAGEGDVLKAVVASFRPKDLL